MVYGMGAPLLAAQLGETNSDGCPNEKANGIMKDYHAAAPYIRELNKICVSEAEKQEFHHHHSETPGAASISRERLNVFILLTYCHLTVGVSSQ